MKTKSMLLLSCFVLVSSVCYSADEARFMRNPDIYKDKIAFSYENDLWVVSSAGGTATRLTNSPGVEGYPKFSPDGKWIAFTGSYDGSQNVYVIPAEGGEPRRVTYQPGGGQVVGWTPKTGRIIFRSYFDNVVGRDPNLYFVSPDGSLPERFPIDRGSLCSFNLDESKMYYTRKGTSEYYWKRYKGGQYQDIWSYDFVSRQFRSISTYVGKNSYPMWIGNTLFFVSDSTNGVSNLYGRDLSGNAVSLITNYSDVDVMMPSTDGQQIVFLHDGYLNVWNTASVSAAPAKISVVCPSDRWSLRSKYVTVKDYVHSFGISNDGKKAVVEARGDVFIVPTEKGDAKNLSLTPESREMYPQMSPDGKTVAFFSDKFGTYQLYIQSVDGGEWTQLTTALERTVYHMLWSPDGKKILFGNKDFALFVLDVATKKLVTIDESHQMKNDEFYWEISDYNWSPDSKWICYSFVQYNRNSQIFSYNLEQEKKIAVTNDFYDNLNPAFDANGDYLYYLSSRDFGLQMDFYEDNHIVRAPYKVMAVQLKAGEKPPFTEGSSAEKKSGNTVQVDADGLLQRTYSLPVESGNYFYLKAGKGKVTWCSVDQFTEAEYEEVFKPGVSSKWQLHVFDMGDKKENVLNDKIRAYDFSANCENLILQKDGDVFTTSLEKAYQSKGIGSKLSLASLTYYLDYRKEWTQIFNDAWRWYNDFFYDKNMHGRDWKALGDRYRAYIPMISSREELNWVLQQLVGELCVSHTYVSGGDMGPSLPQNSPLYTGWLGADLTADKKSGYYMFSTIYGPTEINADLKSPLVRPDVDVKEGYYLIAINGKEIKAPEDYNKYLQISNGQKVTVTVGSKPATAGAKTFEVQPIRYDASLRYFHWLGDNVNKVLKASDGKVGYMHINAMGAGGIGEFNKFWRAFRYKDGLILDVRRNGGGWTEYFLIDKLERKMTAFNVLRGMEPFRYPGSTSWGNYVVISNENNGSDGEAFVEDFKTHKLGTVIGVPSWGGLVGILNGQTTVDNGKVEQSNNAFYNADGKWLVENHGADPDILVDNDPQSVMAGKDLQLEKAIETALQKIKNHPFTFPAVPKYRTP
ncbi:MAG: S41 family peptidase [Ignavibacteriales bacterium]|nr:S41 family peptidase [Ignavibacteriales bacterium]